MTEVHVQRNDENGAVFAKTARIQARLVPPAGHGDGGLFSIAIGDTLVQLEPGDLDPLLLVLNAIKVKVGYDTRSGIREYIEERKMGHG